MHWFQVTCIRRQDGRIVEIGGREGGGWLLSAQKAIQSIQAKPQEQGFFTLVNGVRAEVGVWGNAPDEYLRTVRDGVFVDNLEALDSCPVGYRKLG